MTEYFKKLPSINYAGSPAKNMLARADLTKLTRNSTIFYPYTLKENDKPDTLSFNYYQDSDYAWLIFLTNDIIDPYYNFYLSDSEFNSLINKKYGSVSNAYKFIYNFTTNWATDDRTLSTAAYAALPASLKKYWQPIISLGNSISGYERKKEDVSISTNKIMEFTTANNTVLVNERLVKKSGDTVLASGFVTYSNSTSVTLQHIIGDFGSVPFSVTGEVSNVQITVTAADVLKTNLESDEEIYYSPVYAYDYEQTKNFENKEIKLVDSRFAIDASNDLKKVFE